MNDILSCDVKHKLDSLPLQPTWCLRCFSSARCLLHTPSCLVWPQSLSASQHPALPTTLEMSTSSSTPRALGICLLPEPPLSSIALGIKQETRPCVLLWLLLLKVCRINKQISLLAYLEISKDCITFHSLGPNYRAI